jgi:hypothetical protein
MLLVQPRHGNLIFNEAINDEIERPPGAAATSRKSHCKSGRAVSSRRLRSLSADPPKRVFHTPDANLSDLVAFRSPTIRFTLPLRRLHANLSRTKRAYIGAKHEYG